MQAALIQRSQNCLMREKNSPEPCAHLLPSKKPQRISRMNLAGRAMEEGSGAYSAARTFSRGRSTALATHFSQHFLERSQFLSVDEPQQAHFKVQPRVGFPPKVVVGGQQNIEKACEVFFAEFCRLLSQARALVRRGRH